MLLLLLLLLSLLVTLSKLSAVRLLIILILTLRVSPLLYAFSTAGEALFFAALHRYLTLDGERRLVDLKKISRRDTLSSSSSTRRSIMNKCMRKNTNKHCVA